jgi:hypothetical protein
MGYYTDMRVATTKKGWIEARKRAKEIYEAKINEMVNNAVEVKDNGEYVDWRDGSDLNSWHTALKKFPVNVFKRSGSAEVTTADGETKQYVMYGFTWRKWLGYNHTERQAWEEAWDEIDEPVHTLAIGEDNATEEHWYGDEDYDMPYIEVGGFQFSDQWELR